MMRRPSVQTHLLVFTLFGDYMLHRSGWAWTASLLTLLELLGVGRQAARSALSRMNRRGWLKPERRGRRSLYCLTAKGERLLAQGGQRIFEPRRLGWDGQWHVLVYSLPESERKLRNQLRQRLAYLGFGPLAPGTWVSAHDRRAEVEAVLNDLGACEYAQCFDGTQLAIGDDHEIVKRCWDLKGLDRQYSRFIGRWQPEYERCLGLAETANELPASQCFVQRFWIAHEYSAFPRLDPNLPAELLPEGWHGDQAAHLFSEYRQILSERANEFVEATLNAPNGQKLLPEET